MPPSKQRARSAQDKELRSKEFLQAARELALERGVREVTLTAVTARVGLHPSALRRYYESREELLLELAEEGWSSWQAGLVSGLGDAHAVSADEAAGIISGSLEALPLFCDLLTHAVLSLEGAVRLERARRYKTAAFAAYDAMTNAMVATISGLDREGAQTVLTTAMSTAAYLFQVSRPTATLKQLYATEPRWAHDALRFREQLTALLTTVILGAQQQTRELATDPRP
jgi:AcrR family transcriptional regulator